MKELDYPVYNCTSSMYVWFHDAVSLICKTCICLIYIFFKLLYLILISDLNIFVQVLSYMYVLVQAMHNHSLVQALHNRSPPRIWPIKPWSVQSCRMLLQFGIPTASHMLISWRRCRGLQPAGPAGVGGTLVM